MHSPQNSYFNAAVGLNENQFAVIFANEYEKLKGTAVLGTVNQDHQIAYSEKFTFNSNMTRGISAAKLSPRKVVITFDDSGGDRKGHTVIGNIFNNTVSFTGNTVHNTKVGLNTYNPVAALGNSFFIVGYPDCESFYGYVTLGSTDNFLILGSGKEKWEQPISFYPNPTNGILNIRTNPHSEDLTVKVYDMVGKKLVEEKLKQAGSLDLGSLRKGTYLVQVTDSRRIVIEKVVVK